MDLITLVDDKQAQICKHTGAFRTQSLTLIKTHIGCTMCVCVWGGGYLTLTFCTVYKLCTPMLE